MPVVVLALRASAMPTNFTPPKGAVLRNLAEILW